MLGGIGSGKSYVAGLLASIAGGEIVDADAIAKGVLDLCARDGRLDRAVGKGFVLGDGSPDRPALARHVFSDASALRRLERLVHPEVLMVMKEQIHGHRAGDGPGLLILDVPLLIETGLDRHCDALWFVEVPDALRRARAAERGIDAEEHARREAQQSPLERKRARADFVLYNDRDLEPQILEGLRTLGLAVETRT